MVRRTTASELSAAELASTLHVMGCTRGACIAVMTVSPINGPEYMKALEARETIDRLAKELTGVSDYFMPQGHSTKG